MNQFKIARPTAADRACGSKPRTNRHYAFNPLQPKPDPGGFMFLLIGSSLAVCLIALAIAILSQ